MNKVNCITICRSNFNSQEEFENSIKTAVMVLLENEYIMTVRYDEKGLGIVCIEFDHDDYDLCDNHPMWASLEEIESVMASRMYDDEPQESEAE